MEIIIFGKHATNVYRVSPRNEEYTLMTIESDNGAYNHTLVVDTRLVDELRNYSWHQHEESKSVFVTNMTIPTRKRMQYFGVFEEETPVVLLHRFIAMFSRIPNVTGCKTIDHINREPLDNRIKNLRWAVPIREKTERRCDAIQLPADIGVTELPKYCTWRDNQKGVSFFCIKRHPALKDGYRTSSKSKAVSNQKKFEQALEILKQLNQEIDSDPDKELRGILHTEFRQLVAL